MAQPTRTRSVLIVAVLLISGCGGNEQSAKSSSPPASVGNASDLQWVGTADFSILFIGNSHTGMHRLPEVVGKMIEYQ